MRKKEPVALAKVNTEGYCETGDVSISDVLSEMENIYFLKEKNSTEGFLYPRLAFSLLFLKKKPKTFVFQMFSLTGWIYGYVK